jgi:NAD(P)-dependent dehydrogenase (short-subunit alcohol dehydrogenase family)
MGRKTVIVTGASQGIGDAIVRAFIDRDYYAVATLRSISTSIVPSPNLAAVRGDIGQAATAEKVTQTACGSIDHVINNATIFADAPALIPMITKGGVNAVTRSLAIEYAKKNIRFSAVAPGVVDTSLHNGNSKDSLKTYSPMATISNPEDIADAVLYPTEANPVTGDVLYVDGGAHAGRW